MSDRDQPYPLDRRVWLLAIGRRLPSYDANSFELLVLLPGGFTREVHLDIDVR
jgi:hypothetical protein